MSGGTAGTNINIDIIQCLLYTHDMRIQQQIVNKDGAIRLEYKSFIHRSH